MQFKFNSFWGQEVLYIFGSLSSPYLDGGVNAAANLASQVDSDFVGTHAASPQTRSTSRTIQKVVINIDSQNGKFVKGAL